MFARILPLVLVGLCACSLELPGTSPGDPWQDADPDADVSMDAAPPDAGAAADAADAEGLDAAADGAEPEPDAQTPAMCGSASVGDEQQRVRYAALSVVAPAACMSETQRRTCQESGWSAWSGTFQSEQCSVSTYRSCGAVAHGAQEQRTRYVTALAEAASGCLSQLQSRTCNDGTFSAWSGSYQFVSCAVAFEGSCALDSPVACEQGTSCAAHEQGEPLQCLGGTDHACSDNEQCVATCLDGACGPKPVPGSACDEAADCAGCSNDSDVDCVEGLCRCSDGADCSANDQCQSTCVSAECAPTDARCDDDGDCGGERRCLRKALVYSCLLPDGKACEENAECHHVCRDSECAASGTTGSSCDENADCAGALVCRAGLCQQRAALLTGACDENADCSGMLVCVQNVLGGTCLRATGQACTLAVECASGDCSSSGSGSGSFCAP